MARKPIPKKRRGYRLENRMVKSHKRKKVALADRQPLIRPSGADEASSVDFVFDRLAVGPTLAIRAHENGVSLHFIGLANPRKTRMSHHSTGDFATNS